MKDVSNEKTKHDEQPDGASAPDWSDVVPGSPLAVSQQKQLDHGEVVIEVKETGTEKLVAGRILLNEPVEKIWPILANPFEFAGGIYPRMGKVKVLENEKEHSRMSCTINLGILPDIVAVVDTDYIPGKRIDFHKVGGTLKDLSGGWTLTPRDGGKKTEVAYWMNIDPGIPVPGWIVRQGIKMELPNTLKAVRKRLDEVKDKGKHPKDSILAAEI